MEAGSLINIFPVLSLCRDQLSDTLTVNLLFLLHNRPVKLFIFIYIYAFSTLQY